MNATFAGYGAFNVQRVEIIENAGIKGLTDWADIHAERGDHRLKAALDQAWPQAERNRAPTALPTPVPTRDQDRGHAMAL